MAGGFIYDWNVGKWLPKQHRELSFADRRHHARRQRLLYCLLIEMRSGDGIAAMYANLLARHLIGTDQDLMHDYGERVAAFGHSQHEHETQKK